MPVPKGVDPGKYDRCVEDVKDKGDAKNAYAVCAASLQRNEVDWSNDPIMKSIDRFNGMFKKSLKKVVHGKPAVSSTSGKDPEADKRSDAKKMY
jgi:hypothetical protein